MRREHLFGRTARPLAAVRMEQAIPPEPPSEAPDRRPDAIPDGIATRPFPAESGQRAMPS